jgi:hypothetical protein
MQPDMDLMKMRRHEVIRGSACRRLGSHGELSRLII